MGQNPPGVNIRPKFADISLLQGFYGKRRVRPGLRPPPRIPTPKEISRPCGNLCPIGRLIGVSFASVGVSIYFSAMFCPLCLRSQNSVSRKPRLRFAERRFECKLTAVGRPSTLEWPTRAGASSALGARPRIEVFLSPHSRQLPLI